jgi:hypothetical protein
MVVERLRPKRETEKEKAKPQKTNGPKGPTTRKKNAEIIGFSACRPLKWPGLILN